MNDERRLRAVDGSQLALDERIIDNPQLEQALEEREKLKAKALKARKDYAEANEWATGLAADLNLDDGQAVRVGRFRLTRRAIAARSVAFETSPASRLTITVAKDDE